MRPAGLQGEAQAEAALATQATIVDVKDILANTSPENDEDRGLLRRLVVHRDPEISLFPDFLNDDEIDHLLELTEAGWNPSIVGSGIYKTNDESKDLQNAPSQNRTSYSSSLRSGQTLTIKAIEKKLGFIAGMGVEHLERLNMVRYSPGQYFNKHHDGRFRTKTVFIYCNDLPPGDAGETFFPELSLKITPRKGLAVMWTNTRETDVEDPRLVHQGLPPRSCIKYGVNCFFNAKPIREWEEPDSDDEEPDRANLYRSVDPAELQRSSKQVQSTSLSVFQVNSSPAVVLVPGLLQPHEAETFYQYSLESKPSHAICNTIAALKVRLSAVVGLPVQYLADLHTTSLGSDMLSKPQVMPDLRRPHMQPKKAVLIFLNEVPERGELRFPKIALQVLPRPGTAVIWDLTTSDGLQDQRAVHIGRPPRSGARCSCTCVFHSVPVQ